MQKLIKKIIFAIIVANVLFSVGCGSRRDRCPGVGFIENSCNKNV